MRTKAQLKEDTLMLIEKYNQLALEFGKELLNVEKYKRTFNYSTKPYLTVSNELILRRINNLKEEVGL